jgi:hypothetical protein
MQESDNTHQYQHDNAHNDADDQQYLQQTTYVSSIL